MPRLYQFADGRLALSADDDAFLRRFHELYGALESRSPASSPVDLHGVVLSGLKDAPIMVGTAQPADDGGADFAWTGIDRLLAWQWQAANLVVNRLLATQDQFLFFHAGALSMNTSGVLVMGGSGRGKTSLTLALAARGHTFLGDEIGAVRCATRELVPVPRAAMIRRYGVNGRELAARTLVPLDNRPRHPVPLRAVVCLRSFATETRLVPFRISRSELGWLTPMESSLSARGPARLALDLLRLLRAVDCYVLDSDSPDSAASAIEAALAR